MIKADKYYIETLIQLKESKNIDINPRAKWEDGTPAHTKFITQKVFNYDISKGEFPINTLRNTAIKGAWYDIEAIYIKQTNIIEKMHPSIHSWWKDFIVKTLSKEQIHTKWLDWAYFKKDNETYGDKMPIDFQESSIGKTYGDTVNRYNLVNNLLKGLEFNPFSRRHIINLWQEQQMIDDPRALVPCCFETLWSVRGNKERFIDLTLHQRSQDFLITSSINPIQFVMLGMVVCGHLTHTTGIKYSLGNFQHSVQNLHVYDRHLWAIDELLCRKPKEQPIIELLTNKNFYEYTIEDFKITLPFGIEKLSNKLELAI